jgi:hypothetical protein
MIGPAPDLRLAATFRLAWRYRATRRHRLPPGLTALTASSTVQPHKRIVEHGMTAKRTPILENKRLGD